MEKLIYIFLGGGIGACLRYITTISFFKILGNQFPYGTFMINVVGSLFLGFIIALSIQKTELIDPNIKILLVTGIAGGFTTFSTFSFEALSLFKQGYTFSALGYMILSPITGLIAAYLGTILAKQITQ